MILPTLFYLIKSKKLAMTKCNCQFYMSLLYFSFSFLLMALMMNSNAFAETVEGANNDEKDSGALQIPPLDLSARIEGNATGVYYPMYSLEELPQVLVAKNEYLNVPFNVNINPANGPGTSPSLAWASAITQLKHAGVIITGYVPTRYGNDPVVDVESMISRYQQFYPHMIDGIMLDEVSSSNFTYYKEISDYARSIGFSYIRANPGGSIWQENVPLFNQIAIYEGASYPNQSILESRTFFPQYSKDVVGFGATVHSEPMYDPSWLFMATKYLKWVYITDQTEPNPYAVFPSYFDQYLVDLSASPTINQHAMPEFGTVSSQVFTISTIVIVFFSMRFYNLRQESKS